MRKASFSIVLCLVLVLSGASTSIGASGSSNSTFTVLSAVWGSITAPLEAAPGSQNLPLTVSLIYGGGTQATSILATVRLPPGIADVYGNTAPTAGTATESPNSIFQLTYYLNIASNVATGTYTVPIQLLWTTSGGGSSAVSSETDNLVMNVLGTVTIEFRSPQSSVNSGQVNEIQVTLSNTGSGPATLVTPTVSTSAPSGGGVVVQTSSSGSGVSILSGFSMIPTVGAGDSIPLNVSVYVPSSLAGSSLALYFSAAYTDPYGLSKTVTQAIGLYAVSVPVAILNFNTQQESLVPGGVNDVQVVLTNVGPGAVTRIYTTISVPSQFAVLNQFPTIARLNENSSVTASIRVFVPSSASDTSAPLTFTATYIDAYGTSRTTTQTIGLYAQGLSGILANSSISISVPNYSLVAGQISPVSFVIRNTGTLPLHSPTFTLSVSSPLVVSGNSTFSMPHSTIDPGHSVTYTAMILSSLSASGGSYSGTLTVDYNDQFGDTRSQTFNVGFALTSPVTQISVDSLSSVVSVGNTSTISLRIRNTGTATLYSPVFSLSAPSSLAVIANATFSRAGLNLAQGGQFLYEAGIANGPKTTEGAYVCTLTITYADQFGNVHTTSFPVGVVVVGDIQLLIQDQQVVQNSGSVVISGTLLNEGAGSAFYTQIIANLTGSASFGSGSEYVGEVDPNTPVPFSVTVNHAALSSNSAAKISLSARYRNDFGQSLRTEFSSSSVDLSSGRQASQTGVSSQGGRASGQQASSLLDSARLVVIAAIVIAAVGAFVYVRRSRGKVANPDNRESAKKNNKVV